MSPALNNFAALFDLLGVLARRRFNAGEKAFAAIGLNHTESRLLSRLDREGGNARQERLSASMNVDRSNAGRALKSLELRGLVSRSTDPSDARTNIVVITDKGREMVVEILKVRHQVSQSFFGDITDEEAGAIVKVLSRAIAKDGS